VDYFNFNEQERRLIESLQIKKGEYSEVFFSQSKQLQNISAKMIICPTPIDIGWQQQTQWTCIITRKSKKKSKF